ncbi:hypothetical protein FRC12_006893 [Ceratobasidium sp. 428]|nr:hypothetical protein FRC12_006893 [Ceratobasidium sp. 428]
MATLSSTVLPIEIWGSILTRLTQLSDLCSLSVVCRNWRPLAFPHLYHTVYLSRSSHLEQFAEGVGATSSALSFADHIRELVLDGGPDPGNYRATIFNANLGSLVKVLTLTTGLRRFAWNLNFVPKNPRLFEVLRDNCPNLRTFEFEAPADIGMFSGGGYTRMFDLQNLENMAITIQHHGPLRFNPNLESFALPLRSSPNLKSLALLIEADYDSQTCWSPSTLLNSLKDLTFPSLHSFNAGGVVDNLWYQAFAAPGSDPLGAFFTRHPGLRTISLGWMEQVSYEAIIAPEIVESLFPSLVHFCAPAALSGPVMASKLANQLETLSIIELVPPHGPSLETAAQAARPMPNLRKLVIDGRRQGWVKMDAVKQILGYTPDLEEFDISQGLDQPELLPSLRLIPNLRVLTVETFGWSGVKTDSQWDAYVVELAKACHKLNRVNNSRSWCSWDIERRGDDEVVLHRSKFDVSALSPLPL